MVHSTSWTTKLRLQKLLSMVAESSRCQKNTVFTENSWHPMFWIVFFGCRPFWVPVIHLTELCFSIDLGGGFKDSLLFHHYFLGGWTDFFCVQSAPIFQDSPSRAKKSFDWGWVARKNHDRGAFRIPRKHRYVRVPFQLELHGYRAYVKGNPPKMVQVPGLGRLAVTSCWRFFFGFFVNTRENTNKWMEPPKKSHGFLAYQ